jgi:hypothetical protein
VFALWLFTRITELRWNDAGGLLTRASMVLAGLFVALVLLPSAVRSATFYREPDNEEKIPYQAAAQTVNQTISHGAPVVVGFHPYLYSIFTGAQSLAIPQSDDNYLLTYMDKYHACCVMLTDQERDFWRPQWRAALPPHIVFVRTLDGYNVYKRD